MIPMFRAWDINKKIMYIVTVINFHDNGKVYSVCCCLPNSSEENWFVKEELDNIVLIQSTGIKDKNGIEVFEGDIVRYTGWDRRNLREDIIAEIKHGKYEEYLKDNIYPVECWGWYKLELNTVDKMQYGIHPDYTIGEIVGNIHQNPELLKEG